MNRTRQLESMSNVKTERSVGYPCKDISKLIHVPAVGLAFVHILDADQIAKIGAQAVVMNYIRGKDNWISSGSEETMNQTSLGCRGFAHRRLRV